MVIVDRLSKSTHFLTLRHPFTTKNVAEKFMKAFSMECSSPLLVIGAQFSSVTSGKNSSGCRVPNFNSVMHTTNIRMARYKLSIDASSNIYGVSFISGQKNGVTTYLEWSIGIIPHTIFRPE